MSAWRVGLFLGALSACGAGTDGAGEDGPPPAELAAVSDGACPDLSASGWLTMSSGGFSRKVGLFLPDDLQPGAPLVYAFHGLSPASFDPAGQLVSALDLDELADDRGAIVVVPEARAEPLLSQFAGGDDVLLWGILGDRPPEDLALYDDLRTCLSEAHDIDLRQVYALGFSGGAMWTSYLLLHRADTLAAAAPMSGGADFNIIASTAVDYVTPNHLAPAIISSGGANDAWPSALLKIIDFEVSSDALADGLASDGATVVRCGHSSGHTITQPLWTASKRFLFAHTFGVPSPYGTGDKEVADGCELLD
jgi:hypothetical protein